MEDETETTRLQLVGIAVGLVLAFMMIGTWVDYARAKPAGAPQMVANELAAQRALGYQPCEPIVTQLPAELVQDGALADAGGTLPGETCEIRFAASVPAGDMDWVAWHEVCHLSTLTDIYGDPHRPIIDPAHTHPAFLACVSQGPAETGGYLY